MRVPYRKTGYVTPTDHIADRIGSDYLKIGQILNRVERATSHYEVLGLERIIALETVQPAYIVEIEQSRVRIGGAAEFAPVFLRVPSIFRCEESEWRIVHRRADPASSARPAASIVER